MKLRPEEEYKLLASIKKGRKRVAAKIVEEKIEGITALKSSIEEEEANPKPKKRLVKKGPTLSQALKTKKEKTTAQPEAGIKLKDPAPEPLREEVNAGARRNKGKNVEITTATLHPDDPKYD